MSELANFSKLSPPDLIDTLQYNTILNEIKSDFNNRIDTVDISQLNINDPIIKILEIFALREINIRARINECAKQVLVSSATGSNLDHLGALVGVYRSIINQYDENNPNSEKAEYENDDSFRLRIPLAFERTSNAGTKGAYKFYALNTPGVLDVSVFQNPSNKESIADEIDKTSDALANLDLIEPVSDGIVNVCVLPVNDKKQLSKLSKEAKDEAQKKAACETETLKELAIDIHQQREMDRSERQKDLNMINKEKRKNEIALEQEKNKLNNSNENIEKITKERDDKQSIFTTRKAECKKVNENKIKNDNEKLEYRALLEVDNKISSTLESLETSEEKYKEAYNEYESASLKYYNNSGEKRAKEQDIYDHILLNLIKRSEEVITAAKTLKNANTEYILPDDMKDKDLLNRKMNSVEVQTNLKDSKEDYLENFYSEIYKNNFKNKYKDLKEKYKAEIEDQNEKKTRINAYDRLVSDKKEKTRDYNDAKKTLEDAQAELEQLKKPLLEKKQDLEKAKADGDASRNNFHDEENKLVDCVKNRMTNAGDDLAEKQKDLIKANKENEHISEDLIKADNTFKTTCADLLNKAIKLSKSEKKEKASLVKASNCIIKDDLSNDFLYKIIKSESDDLVKLNKELNDLRHNLKKCESDKDNAKIEFFAASNKLNEAIKKYNEEEIQLDKKTIKKEETSLYIREIKQLSINTIKANYESEYSGEQEVNYYDILTNEKQIKKYPQIVKEKEKAFFHDVLIEPIKKQLNSEEIKPVTDLINVTLANIVHYKISGTVYLNSLFDSDVLQGKVKEINKSLLEYTSAMYMLNQGVTKLGICSAINNEVVDNIKLDEFNVEKKYLDPEHNNDLIPLKHTAYLCNKEEIELIFLVENYNVGKKELIQVDKK